MVNKTLQSVIFMMVDIVLESSFILLVKVDVILREASPQAALLLWILYVILFVLLATLYSIVHRHVILV